MHKVKIELKNLKVNEENYRTPSRIGSTTYVVKMVLLGGLRQENGESDMFNVCRNIETAHKIDVSSESIFGILTSLVEDLATKFVVVICLN